jgi:hypothetical protein
MSDVNDWAKLSDEDKKIITDFTAANSAAVREMMRNKFPSLYIGRHPDEVARGWLMIAGLAEIKNFIVNLKK